MDKVLQNHAIAESKCRKLPVLQAYQRLYYEDRIKPEFEKWWAEQKEDQAKVVASGETLMKTSELMLKLLKEVAAELWENEIEEVYVRL